MLLPFILVEYLMASLKYGILLTFTFTFMHSADAFIQSDLNSDITKNQCAFNVISTDSLPEISGSFKIRPTVYPALSTVRISTILFYWDILIA